MVIYGRAFLQSWAVGMDKYLQSFFNRLQSVKYCCLTSLGSFPTRMAHKSLKTMALRNRALGTNSDGSQWLGRDVIEHIGKMFERYINVKIVNGDGAEGVGDLTDVRFTVYNVQLSIFKICLIHGQIWVAFFSYTFLEQRSQPTQDGRWNILKCCCFFGRFLTP